MGLDSKRLGADNQFNVNARLQRFEGKAPARPLAVRNDSRANSANRSDEESGAGNDSNYPMYDMRALLSVAEKDELCRLAKVITDLMLDRIEKVFNLVPDVKPEVNHFQPHHKERFWQMIPVASILARKKQREVAVATKSDNHNEPNLIHNSGVLDTSSKPINAQYASSTSVEAVNFRVTKPIPPLDLPSNTTYIDATTVPELEAENALYRGEKESQTPGRLSELYREAMSSFEKWSSSILQRFCDITPCASKSPSPLTVPKSGVAINGLQALKSAGFLSASRHYDLKVIAYSRKVITSLTSLTQPRRALILHAIFLLVLSSGSYNAYSRQFMLVITSSLQLPLGVLNHEEQRLARAISGNVPELSPEELTLKRIEEAKNARRRPRGSTLNSVKASKSMAASLITEGVGNTLTLGIGQQAAATLIGPLGYSQTAAAALFGLEGARAGTKNIAACSKDIHNFALIPLHGPGKEPYLDGRDVSPENRRMRILICIDGWLATDFESQKTWECITNTIEAFTLKWDLETLPKIGGTLKSIVRSAAWKNAKETFISAAFPTLLKEGSWPVSLIRCSKVFDNNWSTGMVRADKAGAALADLIMNQAFGGRPVSLVGYSLGARIIYTCLMILAERRVLDMVESVVIAGAPVPADAPVWCTLRTVVTGRLLNVFSAEDYMLGFLYRLNNTQFGVAGLQKIVGAAGVENLDITHMVRGHLRYQGLMGTILKIASWDNLNPQLISENPGDDAVVDEKETNQLIAELDAVRGLPAKIKPVEKIQPESATSTERCVKLAPIEINSVNPKCGRYERPDTTCIEQTVASCPVKEFLTHPDCELVAQEGQQHSLAAPFAKTRVQKPVPREKNLRQVSTTTIWSSDALRPWETMMVSISEQSKPVEELPKPKTSRRPASTSIDGHTSSQRPERISQHGQPRIRGQPPLTPPPDSIPFICENNAQEKCPSYQGIANSHRWSGQESVVLLESSMRDDKLQDLEKKVSGSEGHPTERRRGKRGGQKHKKKYDSISDDKVQKNVASEQPVAIELLPVASPTNPQIRILPALPIAADSRQKYTSGPEIKALNRNVNVLTQTPNTSNVSELCIRMPLLPRPEVLNISQNAPSKVQPMRTQKQSKQSNIAEKREDFNAKPHNHSHNEPNKIAKSLRSLQLTKGSEQHSANSESVHNQIDGSRESRKIRSPAQTLEVKPRERDRFAGYQASAQQFHSGETMSRMAVIEDTQRRIKEQLQKTKARSGPSRVEAGSAQDFPGSLSHQSSQQARPKAFVEYGSSAKLQDITKHDVNVVQSDVHTTQEKIRKRGCRGGKRVREAKERRMASGLL